MSASEENWWSALVRFFRSAFKDEVKTPLAFFFRAAGVLVVVAIGALAAINGADKLHVFDLAMLVLLVLCLIVAIFAWFRPKNLVYGETGHRAEFKFEYGTEKKVLTHRDVQELPGETNPIVLSPAVTDRQLSKGGM
jgi:Na+/melibiose symporter-like transporter